MRRWFTLWLAFAAALTAQKLPFDAAAMMSLKRIADPQISPDGQWVAFSVQSVDTSADAKSTQIWTVPIEGGAPHQITHDGAFNERPRWSPDSKRIAYISNRAGSSQIWLMDLDGGNTKQVTHFATEAEGVLYSPDGKNLLFTSSVYPECGADDACNQKNLADDDRNKVKARIYSELLFRHWVDWQSRRRTHLLAISLDGGAPRDLAAGGLLGLSDYDVSPDGNEVCYSVNLDVVAATSTNADLFVVPIAGPTATTPARKISTSMGGDVSPQYSPDGKYIAWRSQARSGYESDRWRLTVLERASNRITSLTENLDRWVNSFTWAPDSNAIFFTTTDRGRQPIEMIPVTGGEIRNVVSGDAEFDDMQLTRNGKMMVYTQQTGASPVEIYRASSSGGASVALTHLNDATLNSHQMTPLDEFWVDMPDGARVQSFVVKPFGFTSARKYPVLMLIHGGPQGNWGQSWSYRWNAQVFAAAGYVVVMPNPRGSIGYGQKFIDDINHDWGGKPFDDIMAVTDHVVVELPYADGARMVAAGGSYGGYMIDWILGHTQRFKALISHAGLYDLKSMFGATEELWFPLWEMGGTPWDKPEDYARMSPDSFVKDFNTPTLVVAGELDFRVPYTQSLELFTALQLQKIPSKLLVYPDEGHWVLKPQNSLLWYKTVLEWADSWVKK
jgi:dipeptidyl aminopeptidase/acylaminoacyl peptidase